MITVEYRDEDGIQTTSFSTMEECNEFIAFNENKCRSYLDEEFELISINDNGKSTI